LYCSIDELQADLDAWIRDYNEAPPSGPLVLRQDPDADLPWCAADDEGEDDRSLSAVGDARKGGDGAWGPQNGAEAPGMALQITSGGAMFMSNGSAIVNDDLLPVWPAWQRGCSITACRATWRIDPILRLVAVTEQFGEARRAFVDAALALNERGQRLAMRLVRRSVA
jgi:hypothetical protein